MLAPRMALGPGEASARLPMSSSPGLPQSPDSQRGRGIPGGPLGHQQPEWVSAAPWGGRRSGRWSVSTPCPRPCAVLTVLRAFPCRSRLGDADTAATVEEEVRGLARQGLLGRAGVDTAVPAPRPGRQRRATLSKRVSECA